MLPTLIKCNKRETTSFNHNNLQCTLNKIPQQDKVILIDNLDVRIRNKVIRGIKNRYNKEAVNENGEHLIYLSAQNELRITTLSTGTNRNTSLHMKT